MNDRIATPTLKLQHTPGFILKPSAIYPDEVYEVFRSTLPELCFCFEINTFDGRLCAAMDNTMSDWEVTKEPDPLEALEQLRDGQVPILRDWLTDCRTVLEWARRQDFGCR